MTETHPFGNFIPQDTKYLLLGSFTAKQPKKDGYDWFYGSKRNQFWQIIEGVYELALPTKNERQKLFAKLKIAIMDIVLQCERKSGSSLDNNLINIVYNAQAINDLVGQNKLEKVYFSSKFVEKLFNKQFKDLIVSPPDIKLVTLPSPSPCYAAISKQEKVRRYRELLPRLS